MAKTRRRRSAKVRHLRRRTHRVRRNPPKMTPARRALIGRKIRALHRAGKYKRTRISRALTVVRHSVSRIGRRRSGGGGGSSMGGIGTFRGMFSKDMLKLAGGTVAGTFVANYACALVCPKLPGTLGTNPFVNMAVKLAAAALVAKFVAKYSRPVAQGIMIGGVVIVLNDLIKQYAPGVAAATSTAAYLGGRRMGAYLSPGKSTRSLVGPVTPTRKTFGNQMSGIYDGGSAFKSDAWSR